MTSRGFLGNFEELLGNLCLYFLMAHYQFFCCWGQMVIFGYAAGVISGVDFGIWLLV